jgi:hypothetical protein
MRILLQDSGTSRGACRFENEDVRMKLISRGIRIVILAIALITSAVTPSLASAQSVFYDQEDRISWLADANFPASNTFGLPDCDSGTEPCVNKSGSMTYASAVAWVAAMNAANYQGHSNWQLPVTPPKDSTCSKTSPSGTNFGFGCDRSALGSLYGQLFLDAPETAVPIPHNTVGPFSNFQPYLYWSESSLGSLGNATFSFNTGWQGANTAPNFLYVLPMIKGQIPEAPPATGQGLQVGLHGKTVYDPVADVTWLANANLAAKRPLGLRRCTDPTTPSLCIDQDGAMTLDSAIQFIKNMNDYKGGDGFLHQTTWQLPDIAMGCNGFGCGGSADPMGNLYYDQLNLAQGTPVVAAPDITINQIHNLQPYLYWSCQGTVVIDPCGTAVPQTNQEWSFSFGSGFQGTDLLQNELYVTAYFTGCDKTVEKCPTPVIPPRPIF